MGLSHLVFINFEIQFLDRSNKYHVPKKKRIQILSECSDVLRIRNKRKDNLQNSTGNTSR